MSTWGAAKQRTVTTQGVVRLMRDAAQARAMEDRKTEEELDRLEVGLTLNGNKLSFSDRWRLDSSAAAGLHQDLTSLQDQVRRQEEHIQVMERKLEEAVHAKCLAEYKNQILMEMLAAAQLDGEQAVERYKKEHVKCEALKWELSKLTLARID